jgi:hypothetical protein
MILETNENVSHSNVNSKSVVSSAEIQLRENVYVADEIHYFKTYLQLQQYRKPFSQDTSGYSHEKERCILRFVIRKHYR